MKKVMSRDSWFRLERKLSWINNIYESCSWVLQLHQESSTMHGFPWIAQIPCVLKTLICIIYALQNLLCVQIDQHVWWPYIYGIERGKLAWWRRGSSGFKGTIPSFNTIWAIREWDEKDDEWKYSCHEVVKYLHRKTTMKNQSPKFNILRNW